MTKTSGAMHVAKITNRRVDKSGQPREYVSQLLCRTYRGGSKAKHKTLVPVTAQRVPVVALRRKGSELFPNGLNQA